MKIFKNKSGLVLAEALLAIAMLAIGTLVVATIIQNSIRTTILSKNYLIAQNLATEAMEAVKSVRDTNWLLQPDNPECWLEIVPNNDGVCAGKVVTEDGDYRPIEKDGKWLLEDGSGKLDLEIVSDHSEYLLKIDSFGTYDKYAYDGTSNSIFYRGIHVSHLDTEKAVFEIIVEWFEGRALRKIHRNLLLYNYN